MSNGFAGHGGVTAEMDDQKGTLLVTEVWSSSANWIELDFRGDELRKRIYVDADNDEAVELAASLLEAIGKNDMADQVRADSRKLAERAEVRERAMERARTEQATAREAFWVATVDQRAAFDAAMDRVDAEYEKATGEVVRHSRSVDWHHSF